MWFCHQYLVQFVIKLARQVIPWGCIWRVIMILCLGNCRQTQDFLSMRNQKKIELSGNLVELQPEDLDQFFIDNCYKDQLSNKWSCNICYSQFFKKIDVRRHLESKHVKLPKLLCPNCSKPHKTRHSLGIHMKKCQTQDFCWWKV